MLGFVCLITLCGDTRAGTGRFGSTTPGVAGVTRPGLSGAFWFVLLADDVPGTYCVE